MKATAAAQAAAAGAAGEERERSGVEPPVPGVVEEPGVQVPEAAEVPAALGEVRVGEPGGVVGAAEGEPEEEGEGGESEPAKNVGPP
jgi:hypothetical protein